MSIENANERANGWFLAKSRDITADENVSSAARRRHVNSGDRGIISVGTKLLLPGS